MNFDEASKGNLGHTGVGGLMRDQGGKWLGGFMENIGTYTSFIIKLWAIRYGLQLAWNASQKRVIMESNSASLIETLNKMKGLVKMLLCYAIQRS